jgi:hypothetical protein
VTEARLAEILRSTADELVAGFEKSATIKHEGAKGSAREGAVLKLLRDWLPGTVRVKGSSEVIDSAGATSLQQDIVIVDPSTPPFFFEGNQQLWPAECVQGIVEIKARLNKAEVVDACNKIASVKRLSKSEYHPDPLRRTYPALGGGSLAHRPTFGYVVAFKSHTKLQTLADNVIDWCNDHPPEEWPDGIFVLDKGSVCWFVGGTPYECVVSGSRLGFIEAVHERDVLMSMVLVLNMAFVTAWMPPFKIHGYLGATALGVPKRVEPAEPRWPYRSVHSPGA